MSGAGSPAPIEVPGGPILTFKYHQAGGECQIHSTSVTNWCVECRPAAKCADLHLNPAASFVLTVPTFDPSLT
jgi:hypothetical protein